MYLQGDGFNQGCLFWLDTLDVLKMSSFIQPRRGENPSTLSQTTLSLQLPKLSS